MDYSTGKPGFQVKPLIKILCYLEARVSRVAYRRRAEPCAHPAGRQTKMLNTSSCLNNRDLRLAVPGPPGNSAYMESKPLQRWHREASGAHPIAVALSEMAEVSRPVQTLCKIYFDAAARASRGHAVVIVHEYLSLLNTEAIWVKVYNVGNENENFRAPVRSDRGVLNAEIEGPGKQCFHTKSTTGGGN
ncbi:hypothetical protein GGX14DRAFT_383878 [Mycena pura]|uniref:Uncharacterized protein n=1 Tax=Mycena pura TaxID=153505 RepID=A0AAD6YUA0_9AGAR|nr:hypothetical protein GGX14DRAFT_383878 [Mycena pura]